MLTDSLEFYIMHLNSAHLSVFPYSSLTPAPKENFKRANKNKNRKPPIFPVSPSPSFVLVVLAAVCHLQYPLSNQPFL